MTDESIRRTHSALVGLTASLDDVHVYKNETVYLDPTAALWRYGADNAVMLGLRAKELGFDPLLLGSWWQWRELGRTVNMFAEPFVILAPVTDRSLDFVDYMPEDPNRHNPVAFRPAYIYDVRDTAGAPLPAPPSSAIAPHPNARMLYDQLAQLVADAGYRLTVSDRQIGLVQAWTMWNKREIDLPGWATLTERTAALAHEVVHMLLHDPDDLLRERYRSDPLVHGIAEVEAEAGAYAVLTAHGIDSHTRSANYVAGWTEAIRRAQPETPRHQRRADIARASLGRVPSVVKTILAAAPPPKQQNARPLLDLSLQHDLDAPLSAPQRPAEPSRRADSVQR